MKRLWILILCVALIGSLTLPPISTLFAQKKLVPGPYSFREYQGLTGKKISRFNEAPMLSELVKQGKLPPVSERLPKEPLVMVPVEEIGRYGGTWKRAVTGVIETWPPRNFGETYTRWGPTNLTNVLPNVAESWTISKDARDYTIRLRKGIKWSDGVPFTADDVVFWYEDILLNKELTPVTPVWIVEGGYVKKLDTYTVKIHFSEPNALFMEECAGSGGDFTWGVETPSHFLKQYHPRYTPKEELEKKFKAKGFDSWYKFFAVFTDWTALWYYPECPRLWAWVPKEASSTRVVLERNPYYWKIDPNGNQLPYIDRVEFLILGNPEVVTMRAIAGELDVEWQYTSFMNYPLYIEGREKGDYSVFKWMPDDGSYFTLFFNLNHKDPILKEIFQDKRFRQGMSLAINREEINQLCFLGQGEPRQSAPLKACPYYEEEFAKAYAEYNPQKANTLLDEMGLTKRDEDGYRLRPDGKTLAVTIEISTVQPYYADIAELVKRYWEKVGVKTAIKAEERMLLQTRLGAGEHDIGVWSMDGAVSPVIDRYKYIWQQGTGLAPLWARWHNTKGKQGEEPIPEVKKLLSLYDQIGLTTNKQKRIALGKEFMRLRAELCLHIGTVGALPQIAIIKNKFRNVPEDVYWGYISRTPRNIFPEQFFIKQ